MKHFFNDRLPIGRTTFRELMLFCVIFISVLTQTACQAKETELVKGLAVQVFNYSQESIAFMSINGQRVGGSSKKAKVGDIEGGGSNCCPLVLLYTDSTVDVLVEASGGNYTTKATVEHPWPSSPNTATIHILPGRKIVIEVGFLEIAGRRDLIEAQIKALGLKLDVPLSDLALMRTEPHEYTEYFQSKK